MQTPNLTRNACSSGLSSGDVRLPPIRPGTAIPLAKFIVILVRVQTALEAYGCQSSPHDQRTAGNHAGSVHTISMWYGLKPRTGDVRLPPIRPGTTIPLAKFGVILVRVQTALETYGR